MDIPIEAMASLGVGGVLAVVIFLMYRKDKNATEKRISDICEGHETRLCEDRKQLVNMIERDQVTRDGNTRALQELTTTLERMNGRNR